MTQLNTHFYFVMALGKEESVARRIQRWFKSTNIWLNKTQFSPLGLSDPLTTAS